MKRLEWAARLLVLLFGLTMVAGCGNTTGSTGGSPAGSTPTTTTSTPTPTPTPTPTSSGCGTSGTLSICLAASTATLPADGTSSSTITATVTNSGTPVADGTAVTFSASNTLGTLSATSATTTGGNASVTLTAGTTTGSVVVTASQGGATISLTISLGAPPASAGGVQFISATPSTIGVQGAGLPTTATAIFLVTDATGTPLPNVVVAFTMIGPNGGEYIGPLDTTPTTATGTTDSTGKVSVILNSGAKPGPVTITASVTVGTSTFSASASTISIGGAIPELRHFSISASKLNILGLLFDGETTSVTVLIGDQFSNYNVLAGTVVSFYTEAGAIDTSGMLDSTGKTTVTLRTQDPRPLVAVPAADPRNGVNTIIATVRGEECFNDLNGNGVYDPPGEFSAACDEGEPYIDANSNGVYDVGESFIDDNRNGLRDGPNGLWDGPTCAQTGCNKSPLIWRALDTTWSGNIDNCTIVPVGGGTTYTVNSGGSQDFDISVGDVYNSLPIAGTKINVSVTGSGSLLGTTSFTVPDGILGPYTARVRLVSTTTTPSTTPASTVLVNVVPGDSRAVACSAPYIQGLVY